MYLYNLRFLVTKEKIFEILFRISGMVENLCTHYGVKVCDLDGKSFYAFPTVEALAQAEVEAKLRALGFGYRACYISKTAQQVKHLTKLNPYSLDNAILERVEANI